jgi:ATP-dependent helicase/nuclease subunit A
LQRFPLESQVTPHFSVLDEREQALLRRDAFDATVASAAEDSDGVVGKALAKIVGLTTGDYIREVTNTVLGERAELARMVAYHESHEDWAEAEGICSAPVRCGRAGRRVDRAACPRPDRREDRHRHFRVEWLRCRGKI